jgi:transcriptional regulator with XRE-family HTH domain
MTASIMKEPTANLNERIAARVRELRAKHGVSLDTLANRSGVSRSMISLIERGESSPTAVVLDKLAAGLGVPLASMFDSAPEETKAKPSPVARRSDQSLWSDPATGYVRRKVSPTGTGQRMEIAEIRFPAGGRIAFEGYGKNKAFEQQIWVLAGEMKITVGKTTHHLQKGDCLAMQVSEPTMFHNPGRISARYAVVISTEPTAK